MTAAGQPRRQWFEKIDRILYEGQFDHEPTRYCAADHENTAPMTLSQASNHDPLNDHPYNVTRTSDEVQTYIAGYVVRKMMRWLKCSECIDTLQR